MSLLSRTTGLVSPLPNAGLLLYSAAPYATAAVRGRISDFLIFFIYFHELS